MEILNIGWKSFCERLVVFVVYIPLFLLYRRLFSSFIGILFRFNEGEFLLFVWWHIKCFVFSFFPTLPESDFNPSWIRQQNTRQYIFMASSIVLRFVHQCVWLLIDSMSMSFFFNTPFKYLHKLLYWHEKHI